MGDAIGVAGSAVGIISLGIQAAQGILWYYRAWKDQDGDISKMCSSLDNLIETLQVLLKTIEPPATFGRSVKGSVENSINAFHRTLKKLESELEKVKNAEPLKPGARSKIRRHVRRACYPFKEATLVKIQGGISDARSDLGLALDVLGLDEISDIHRQVNTIVRWQEDQETQRIVDWLSPLNSWLKQADISNQRQTGTGKWLLDDPIFLEWVKGDVESIWCRGMPGVGKTVLASAVIEFLEKDLPIPDIGLAFIYCNYKERLSQKVEYFAGTIVRQLVEQRPAIADEVRELYEERRGKGTRLSCAEYLGLLQSLAKGCSAVYIIVDALDECIDKDEEPIWSSLLTKLKASVPNMHLFCASRHISDVGGSLAGSAHIEIRATDADIEAYVREQIKSKDRLLGFCREDSALQDEVLEAVRLKSKGMFLAAQLHVESLAKRKNLRAVRKALHKLPEKLDSIYDEAMERIKQQSADDSRLALQLLSWIVYAVRPLQLIEIQHAMAVDDTEPGDRSISKDSLTSQNIIINACAGMIKVDEEGNIIRLIHYTMQEYFERSGLVHFPNAQRDIGVTCLKYLSLGVFGEGYCLTDELYEHRLKTNPLLDYAARNWGSHIREESEQTVQDLALKFLLDGFKVSSSSQVLLTPKYSHSGYSQRFPDNFQGVHYVAYFGLIEIMAELLIAKDGIDPDSKDSYSRTPLSLAAKSGHEAVVKLLLAKGGIDPDSKDHYDRTPLSLAAKNGHEAVVELLLAKIGVDPDSKDRYGWNPLSLAAANGHEAVVMLLLAKDGVDPDSKDGYIGTPLSLAAENGHSAVVKLLLAKDGVDPDSKDSYNRTPLSLAAVTGHEAVVKLLLAKDGVDPDSRDCHSRNPLSWAAMNGHEAVVKLLLAKDGVDPDSKDSHNRTPLSWAAENGREAVVKLLLAKDDVDPDSKDSDNSQTPLLLATKNGHEAVVKLLLAKDGVDPDSKDGHSRTPLLLAAMKGREAATACGGRRRPGFQGQPLQPDPAVMGRCE
ncbi:MAG: hypothetical protein M1839_000604 [Geoglossum umbratile]|nr:MAG: hypothetical protein M1839_000604 [Geoglossum umbratile]